LFVLDKVKKFSITTKCDCGNQDLNEFFYKDAVHYLKALFTTDNRTGCRFLTIDAYNRKEVLRFYKKNEFDFLHDEDKEEPTRIMFYDLKRFSLTT